MIKLFDEFINEGKQVGIVYHFTSIPYLQHILAAGSIQGSSDFLDGYEQVFVSATRNYDLDWLDKSVRLTLDGDRISDNYKVEPIHYFNRENKAEFRDKGPNHKHYKKVITNQYEERIWANKLALVPYVLQIDINKSVLKAEDMESMDDVRQKIVQQGIMVNVVDKYIRFR